MKNLKEEHLRINRLITDEAYDLAYQQLNSLIIDFPFEPDFYSLRGVVKFHLGKKNQALEDMNKAVELEPEYSYRYASRAYIKDSLGMTKEAVEDYEIATKLDPEDPIAYNNLGLLKEKLGYINEAKKHFDKADELEKILKKNNITEAENLEAEIPNNSKEASSAPPSKWQLIKSVFTNKSSFKEFKSFIFNGFKTK